MLIFGTQLTVSPIVDFLMPQAARCCVASARFFQSTMTWKSYEETKYTLKGRSQEAMVDWMCEIKEMGRVGLQAVTDSKET